MASHFDLLIMDCDGVLVDSERLAVRTEAQVLSGLGWSLTESDIVERFVGRSAAYMHQEIERQLGRTVDWDVEFGAKYQAVFERELVAVPGVVEGPGPYRHTDMRRVEWTSRDRVGPGGLGAVRSVLPSGPPAGTSPGLLTDILSGH